MQSCGAQPTDACHAAVGFELETIGCRMCPMPRGIGETTYTIAPNTMIDSTLMTQSRIVIAVASGSGTPYATVRTPMTPAWAKPRPAGLSGIAVRSDPMSATKSAPDSPISTSLKPSDRMTM